MKICDRSLLGRFGQTLLTMPLGETMNTCSINGYNKIFVKQTKFMKGFLFNKQTNHACFKVFEFIVFQSTHDIVNGIHVRQTCFENLLEILLEIGFIPVIIKSISRAFLKNEHGDTSCYQLGHTVL